MTYLFQNDSENVDSEEDNDADSEEGDIDVDYDDNEEPDFDYADDSDAEFRKSVYREDTTLLEEYFEEQIEATKKDVSEEFNASLAKLKSEKNWFLKKTVVKRSVAEAIEELNNAYHALPREYAKIPREIVNDFRMELGQRIFKNKIVPKLCGVIVNMYPKKYRRNKTALIPEFETVFGILWGYTDASEVVARDAALNSDFLETIAEILTDMCESFLDGSLMVSNN